MAPAATPVRALPCWDQRTSPPSSASSACNTGMCRTCSLPRTRLAGLEALTTCLLCSVAPLRSRLAAAHAAQEALRQRADAALQQSVRLRLQAASEIEQSGKTLTSGFACAARARAAASRPSRGRETHATFRNSARHDAAAA